MNNKYLAEKYYRHFSKLLGNQHIANLFAIEKILDILKIHKPKRILEVGLGIGSISYSIMDYFQTKNELIEYYGTEANEFCLEALSDNLGEYYSKLKLFLNINQIEKINFFDLVLIDGSDHSLENISKLISKHGIIFIEGDRKSQQEFIIKLFPKHKLVHTISNYKEPEYGPFVTGDWSGGGKLIFINPTVRQYIHWLIERLISFYRNRITRKRFKSE